MVPLLPSPGFSQLGSAFICLLVPKLLLLQQMLFYPPTLCSYFNFNTKPVSDRSGKTDSLKDHEDERFHQREARQGLRVLLLDPAESLSWTYMFHGLERRFSD